MSSFLELMAVQVKQKAVVDSDVQELAIVKTVAAGIVVSYHNLRRNAYATQIVRGSESSNIGRLKFQVLNKC